MHSRLIEPHIDASKQVGATGAWAGEATAATEARIGARGLNEPKEKVRCTHVQLKPVSTLPTGHTTKHPRCHPKE